LLKTTTSVLQPQNTSDKILQSPNEIVFNASIGHVPGVVVVVAILVFYGWLIYIMFKHRVSSGDLAYGEVPKRPGAPADPPHGLETPK
jgi:uncharacterized membrane protein